MLYLLTWKLEESSPAGDQWKYGKYVSLQRKIFLQWKYGKWKYGKWKYSFYFINIFQYFVYKYITNNYITLILKNILWHIFSPFLQ